MRKYIDADLLRKELEQRLKNVRDYMGGAGMKYRGPKYYKAQGKESAYDALLSIISSLQQEQPEVDLENEIDGEWKKCNPIDEGMGVESAYIHIEAFDIIAHHFFELGQKDAANKYDEIEYNRQRAEEENK